MHLTKRPSGDFTNSSLNKISAEATEDKDISLQKRRVQGI
jgi:hypothetical protein